MNLRQVSCRKCKLDVSGSEWGLLAGFYGDIDEIVDISKWFQV